MESRLEWIVPQPRQWAHWEPLQGGMQAHALLLKRYPKSREFVLVTPVERAQAARKLIAMPWWNPKRWWGPTTRYEAPEAPVQMLWANMALHLSSDPQALIACWHQLLDVDGFLMFSCLGPDTLREIRTLYAAQGWPVPTHTFTDMHDWGDMLVRQGFAEPVMDMERITLSFTSPQTLLEELRSLGRNLSVGRFPALRGRGWLAQLHATMRERLATPAQDGRLSLTFEVIYGHAFKPPARLTVTPETRVSLDEMRQALSQVKGNSKNS
jgi:malonyl-CoA O-methyltransferase